MSIQEQAAELRALNESDTLSVVGLLQQVGAQLDDLRAKVGGILGTEGEWFYAITGMVGEAKQAVTNAESAVMAAQGFIVEAANYHAK